MPKGTPFKTEPAQWSQKTFMGLAWGGVAVSFIFLGVRLFTRFKGFKRVYIDDAFVVFAWLVCLGTAIAQQLNSNLLYEMVEVESGHVASRPGYLDRAKRYPRNVTVIMLLFYTSLWAVKLSFLFFFHRLVAKVAGHRVLWWTIFAVTAASYIVVIGDIRWPCVAASYDEIRQKCTSPQAARFSKDILKVNGALDVVTDYLIMAIPINLLRKVRIPLRKKIALAGLFSIVVITTVIAIVRITMINIIMDRVLLWSSIEQSVAIIVACLGAFPSLFIIQSRAPSPEKRHPPAVVDASLNRARQRMKVLRPSDTELINSGRSSSSITDDSNLTRQDDVTNGNKATDEYA